MCHYSVITPVDAQDPASGQSLIAFGWGGEVGASRCDVGDRDRAEAEDQGKPSCCIAAVPGSPPMDGGMSHEQQDAAAQGSQLQYVPAITFPKSSPCIQQPQGIQPTLYSCSDSP